MLFSGIEALALSFPLLHPMQHMHVGFIYSNLLKTHNRRSRSRIIRPDSSCRFTLRRGQNIPSEAALEDPFWNSISISQEYELVGYPNGSGPQVVLTIGIGIFYNIRSTVVIDIILSLGSAVSAIAIAVIVR